MSFWCTLWFLTNTYSCVITTIKIENSSVSPKDFLVLPLGRQPLSPLQPLATSDLLPAPPAVAHKWNPMACFISSLASCSQHSVVEARSARLSSLPVVCPFLLTSIIPLCACSPVCLPSHHLDIGIFSGHSCQWIVGSGDCGSYGRYIQMRILRQTVCFQSIKLITAALLS